jgi:NAD(P)-dependent dehydrogenase (short-subunit alcohol dehydrogenase family)
MKLANQVAIVTGAGRNIGEEVAKTLAAEGAKVAVADMDKGRGIKVAAAIAQAGGEAAAFVVNVAIESEIAALVEAVVAKWGRIDILINSAAISDNKTILDITKEQWDAVIAVTLTGPFLMSQHVARQMVTQGTGGRIVNIGSTSGFFGRSRAIAYSAAKGEFDPTRPVVNLRGRPGVPLDMARAILFLVSEDSDFIAGTMLFVDGGVSAMLVGDRSQ